eukprot:s4394_g1.t1
MQTAGKIDASKVPSTPKTIAPNTPAPFAPVTLARAFVPEAQVAADSKDLSPEDHLAIHPDELLFSAGILPDGAEGKNALLEDASSDSSIIGQVCEEAFRVIRITRIVKAVRLMRIFRFVMALRTLETKTMGPVKGLEWMLITSIMHTLKSLFWAMVLLVLIIYAFAVLLAQVVNDHSIDQGESNPLGIDDAAAAERYFGSVQNTMLKPATICRVFVFQS